MHKVFLKFNYSIFVLLGLLVLFTRHADAKNLHIHLDSILYVQQHGEENDFNRSKRSYENLGWQLGACYFISTDICLGMDYWATYLTNRARHEVVATGVSTESTGETSWYGTGVTVGYHQKPFLMTGTYFFDAERLNDSTSMVSDYAFKADIAALAEVMGILLGPQLSFIYLNYGQYRQGSNSFDLGQNVVDQFFLPSVTARLLF